MEWRDLATTSHYQTAVAVKDELAKGNIEEATAGIEELIEALSRADKRALRSQLSCRGRKSSMTTTVCSSLATRVRLCRWRKVFSA
jgi:hypothetical protein